MELRPDVVAGKYDPSKFDESGATLLINEIFYSLQGEGAHAGKACCFIRLAKCNLACRFCDTEFETFISRTVQDIVHYVHAVAPTGSQVTLTGGEPMLQNCGPLLAQLKFAGYQFITMETSGSVWSEWAQAVHWITVSPKVRSADIPDPLKLAAKEYKWIVNATYLKQLEANFAQCFMPGNVLNFLQPEWGPNREKYTTAAVKLVQRYPDLFRMSLQQHKLMGVP
jgi:organic radical activating enzyme